MSSNHPIKDLVKPGDNWARPEFGQFADVLLADLKDIDDAALACLLCYFAPPPEGAPETVRHALLEGMNGTAKTHLARQLNAALLGPLLRSFYRVARTLNELERCQGSPELSPSDIVGADSLAVEEEGVQAVRFAAGPLLQNHLMFYADELNRSHPRTQSVLLEAMAEGQVTINTQDTSANRLPRFDSFFLVASQNPERHIGTFPLPEAQLDRFMIRVFMPYSKELEDIVKVGNSKDRPGKEVAFPEQLLVAAMPLDDTSSRALFPKRDWAIPTGTTYATLLHELCKDKVDRIGEDQTRAKARSDHYRAQLAQAGVSPTLVDQFHFNQTRPERRQIARALRQSTYFGTPKALDAAGYMDHVCRKLAEDAVGQTDFQEEIEHLLIAIRREELKTQRRRVGQLKPDDTIWRRIGRLVYATWSRRGASETAEGLADMVIQDERVQKRVGELGHGSSVRGAEALRDLAYALAWARNDSQVRCADVDAVAPYVLNHRVKLVNERPQGWYTRDLIADLVQILD